MKMNNRIWLAALALAMAGAMPLQAGANAAVERPAVRAVIAGTTLPELQSLLAAQPQLTFGNAGDVTPSGLPRLYGVTARALKQHASAEQIAALREHYERDAKQGNVTALWSAGKFHEEGLGGARDYLAAMAWYRQAADKGDSDAQNQIGYLYSNAFGVKQDWNEALAWYRKAAESGNATAQHNLAWRYKNGEGVKRNDRQSAAWFAKSAKQGMPEAQFQLAKAYLTGKGVKKNPAVALDWLRKSAAQMPEGAAAQNLLGELTRDGHAGLKKDAAAAQQHFRSAAEAGDRDAAYNLAAMLAARNERESYPEAIYWYSYAADQEHILAQLQMGEQYEKGYGMPRTPEVAAHYYRKAAEQGNVTAQYRLGMMLKSGNGVVQNEVEAKAWLDKAIKQGYRPALMAVVH